MKNQRNIIVTVVAVLLIIVGFFTLNRKGNSSEKNVTIGVVSQSKQDEAIWKIIRKDIKDKYGINVKIKNFTDYTQPNKALQNGDIDLNAFQHQAFLDAWNKANKGTIVSIGKTFIAPIRLYSNKYKSIKKLPKGATISLPNDATNESRALFVLKNAGLITFKKNCSKLATIKDIATNKKQFKLKEIGAEQTARTLSDVDAAFVNNNYAIASGLKTNSAIYTEPVNKDSKQWINIICSTRKNKNNPLFKKIIKVYQTNKVKQLYKKYYGNTQIPAWDMKL